MHNCITGKGYCQLDTSHSQWASSAAAAAVAVTGADLSAGDDDDGGGGDDSMDGGVARVKRP